MNRMTLLFVLLMGLFTISCTKNVDQTDSVATSGCFKGILVKKGMCGQRVIQITSQNKDGVAYASQWTDEGTTYNNVFSVSNTCTFPATVNVGDELNFEIIAVNDNNCVQCQAYTPVPDKENNIRVIAGCAQQQN